jgi:hypothetical protein
MKVSPVIFSVMTILSTVAVHASIGDTILVKCQGSVDKTMSFEGYLGGYQGKIALRYKNNQNRYTTKTMDLTLTSRPGAYTKNFSYTSNLGEDDTNYEVRVNASVFVNNVEGSTDQIKLVVMPAYSQSESGYGMDCNVKKAN